MLLLIHKAGPKIKVGRNHYFLHMTSLRPSPPFKNKTRFSENSERYWQDCGYGSGRGDHWWHMSCYYLSLYWVRTSLTGHSKVDHLMLRSDEKCLQNIRFFLQKIWKSKRLFCIMAVKAGQMARIIFQAVIKEPGRKTRKPFSGSLPFLLHQRDWC